MFLLVLVIAIVALVASLSSLSLVLTAAPSPAPGDGDGTVPAAALIWGHAVVTDCSVIVGSFVFKIQYANVGGTTATNVTAQYTIYQFDDPTIRQMGTVSIGTVEAGTTGSVSQTSSMICGFWGHNVEVSFSWT